LYPTGHDAFFYFNRGEIKFHNDEYDSAIKDYDEAIRLDPYAKWRDIELREGMAEEEIISRLGKPDRTNDRASFLVVEKEWGLPVNMLDTWKVTYYSPIEHSSGTGRSYHVTTSGYRISLLFRNGKLYAWKKQAEAAPNNS